MSAAPSPSKQSRTHQPPISLPPCSELIEQVDAHVRQQYAFAQLARLNNTRPPPPGPILPLIQRAPGQAPYTSSKQTKTLPPLLVPPPPGNLMRTMYGPYPATMSHRSVATSMPATHRFREGMPPPTVGNPHPDLRVFVLSPESHYAMMQSSSYVITSTSTAGHPISHSKPTNNNAQGIRKTTAHGKAAVKGRRGVRRSEGAE